MKQSKEVPCHVFGEQELLATMASQPYVWATARTGVVLKVLSEDNPSHTNDFRFDRRSFRDCFPIAAICLDQLRGYYVLHKPRILAGRVTKWRQLEDENPRIAKHWTPLSYQEFISADIFEDLIFEHLTVHNVGLQKTLSIIALSGGEYNDIDEVRAALLAQHLISIAMTTTCDDSWVCTPVLANSKDSIQ